jgi:hypothetical protein
MGRDFSERQSPVILNATALNLQLTGREFIDYIPPNRFPNQTFRIANCVQTNVKEKLPD